MPPLVALTSVHGSFVAHVLAARLTSEGIDVELRGALGAPYGLTVGDMARIDLYVPEDQVEDARLVLLAAEVDDAMVPPEIETDHQRGAGWVWVAALVLVVAAAAAPLVRYLAD